MKISIRIHILTVIAVVVFAIVIGIVTTNYYGTSKIINTSAQNIFQKSTLTVKNIFATIFMPTRYRLNFAAELIQSQYIIPNDSPRFILFLQKTQRDITECSLSSFSSPNGNYYEIYKYPDGTYNKLIVTCAKTICQATNQHVDANLHALEPLQLTIWRKADKKLLRGNFTPYDPRERLWYQEALQSKKVALSDIYRSIHGMYAIKLSAPIYASSGELLGVLSLQTKLQTFKDFVDNLKVTENSAAFLLDDKTTVIRGRNGDTAWAETALRLYKQNPRQLFDYKFAGKTYLAHFDQIAQLPKSTWFLGIVLPMQDISAPLITQVIISFAITIAILTLGLIVIWFVAKALSKPIIQLVSEAALIRKLEFPANKKPTSRIREIFYLQGAFNNMKDSLRSFRRYVPFVVVKNLLIHSKIAKVGGVRKTLTILFSDINGFTTLSEHLPAEQLTKYLSTYFEEMTREITKSNGTVDKYIGDAVMALWGAPLDDKDHALHACKCAVQMQDSLERLNAAWQKENLPELQVRIGIHTGEVVVGNIGSEERLNYTVIGDNVNLASRLEGLNKLYKTKIIVSEATYQLVKENFLFRLLDNVAVKGKTTGVRVYELLLNEDKFSNRLAEYNSEFAYAFNLYQKGLWDDAMREFDRLMQSYPNDELAKFYSERCAFLKNHQPTDWQGVWRLQ
jgi:adenylate cyclase